MLWFEVGVSIGANNISSITHQVDRESRAYPDCEKSVLLDIWIFNLKLVNVCGEIRPAAEHAVILSIRDEDNVNFFWQCVFKVLEQLLKCRENFGPYTNVDRVHAVSSLDTASEKDVLISQFSLPELMIQVSNEFKHGSWSILYYDDDFFRPNDDWTTLLNHVFLWQGIVVEIRQQSFALHETFRLETNSILLSKTCWTVHLLSLLAVL